MCRRSWKFPAVKKRAASSRSCSLFRVSSEGVFLRTAILIGLVCLSAGLMGCESPAKNPAADTSAQKPTAPAVPDDIFAAASGTLSSEVEVLAWGDLALTGRQQILAINRLNKPELSTGSGGFSGGTSNGLIIQKIPAGQHRCRELRAATPRRIG